MKVRSGGIIANHIEKSLEQLGVDTELAHNIAYTRKGYQNTYLTIDRDETFGEWIYKGACLKGGTVNREYEFEVFDMNYINLGIYDEEDFLGALDLENIEEEQMQ